jgi:hypothetical protein
MLIKCCLQCKFHETKEEQREKMSYCSKENCWSQYAKCLLLKALNQFLEQECVRVDARSKPTEVRPTLVP